MTNEEKISAIEEFFWKNFIKVEGDDPGNTAGCCIPYTKAHVVNGETAYAEIDDGTINIADAMTLQWIKNQVDAGSSYVPPIAISDYIKTLIRLAEKAYSLYSDNWYVAEHGREYGFFLRDDVDDTKIKSAYGMLLRKQYEDPCHSPFVSQDQVWCLNPILYRLASEGDSIALSIGKEINSYIKTNGYKLYNPYLSRLAHFYTYCPTFNTSKVAYDERQSDRDNNYSPSVKVKRGANNWYYSGGTKAVLKAFKALSSGDKVTFRSVREICYKGIIFFLDRIYEPIYKVFTGSDFKHNSYYCYAAASGIWYGKKFKKRFLKKFNKYLSDGKAFEPNIVPLVLDKDSEVDTEALLSYLDEEIGTYYDSVKEASEDTIGTEYIFSSPVELLILWYFYRYITEEQTTEQIN